MNVMTVVNKLMAPVQRRVRLMVARAIVELVDDSKKMQSLQISIRQDELRDDVEHFQPHGFSSVPEDGAEAIVLHVGGGADHPVVIAVDDRRYRPRDLNEGEACIWTTQDGKRFYAKDDGEVHIGADDEDLSDDQLVALAKLVKDEISALRDTVNNFVTTFNTHLHPSGMGPTGTPASPATSPASVGDVKCTLVKVK